MTEDNVLTCEFCNEKFYERNKIAHYKYCRKNPENTFCKYCNKLLSSDVDIKTHHLWCKKNPNYVDPNHWKSKSDKYWNENIGTNWSRGLTRKDSFEVWIILLIIVILISIFANL